MKRNKMMALLLACCLVFCLALPLAGAATGIEAATEAEGQPLVIDSADFGDFVVGLAGKLTGDFFTNLWGNSTYDMDMRALLHGYETVVFNEQYDFTPNPTAITAIDQKTNKDGGKTYTLTIADGLTYSDGTPIGAADYVFALLLAASPQVRELGGATEVANHIQGYDAFNAGQAETLAGLRLLDEHRFSMTVKPECLPFFYELSMVQTNPYPIAAIAPGCRVADEGKGAYIANADPAAAEPVFTADLLRSSLFAPDTGYAAHPTVVSGPYLLQAFDAETGEARLTINEKFAGDWQGQQPAIDNLVVRYLPPADLVGALERGEVHLVNKVVPGDDIRQGMNSEAGLKNSLYPRLGFGFLSFSCETGPTQFEAVRKAIAYAVDVPAFATEYTQSFGLQVHGYYGIGQWMVQLITSGGPPEGTEAWLANPGTPAEWEALSLDQLGTYSLDLDQAKTLLTEDGWVLNADGQPYVEGTDSLRHKLVGEALMPLTLCFAKQQDNAGADLLVLKLMEPMATLGMKLEVAELSFGDLLRNYYSQGERPFHMAFLATNFSSVFDPSLIFGVGDTTQRVFNTSGLRDEELAASALALRRVAPGDLLGYCRQWLNFQQVFNDKLPMLPLYSNVYFDFSTPLLQNYNPGQGPNWPNALLSAYLGQDAPVDADLGEEGEAVFEEGEEVFLD